VTALCGGRSGRQEDHGHLKGKVRLVIKNYPYKIPGLCPYCGQRRHSLRLIRASTGKMHDLLLKTHLNSTGRTSIKYAKELGLDLTAFTASIDSKEHAAEIEKDKQTAL